LLYLLRYRAAAPGLACVVDFTGAFARRKIRNRPAADATAEAIGQDSQDGGHEAAEPQWASWSAVEDPLELCVADFKVILQHEATHGIPKPLPPC
jgi:hypothetical protein